MTIKTIKQLIQLNLKFYQDVAVSFDDSRKYSWQGWQQLLPIITSHFKQLGDEHFTAIDLGCGNARWASFLAENLQPQFSYLGIDSNETLLDLADKRLTKLDLSYQLVKKDIMSDLISADTLSSSSNKLITLFGFWHHIPSSQLRKTLLTNLWRAMTPQDLLVITTWNFALDKKFAKKVIAPDRVGIDHNQLEPGDYILDWQRGGESFRYCHFSSQSEMEELISEANFKLVNHFLADGQSKQLNSYYLLQKAE
jgi:tRNA (uracil-5-)-methyltransferase TRM9